MDNQYLLLALLLVPALYVVRAKLSNARTVNVSVPVLGKPTKPVNRKDVNEDNIVVSQIWVFPIKSCRGTSVQQARLSPVGFQYDRKWSIVTAQDHNVISLRAYPQLTHIIPQIQEDPNSPFGGLLIVQVPSGENDGVTHTFSVPLNPPPDMLESWDYLEDVMPLWFKAHMDGYICQSISGDSRSPSAILSKFLKKDVLLVMKGPQDRSCPRSEMFPDLKATMTYCDTYPVHFATQESLDSLTRAVNLSAQVNGKVKGVSGPLDPTWANRKVQIERFRPNLVFEGAGVPYAEDLWGEVEIRSPASLNQDESTVVLVSVADTPRCTLPNVDPLTGTRDISLNSAILPYGNTDSKTKKSALFGTYAVPVSAEGEVIWEREGRREEEWVVRVGGKVKVRRWCEEGQEGGRGVLEDA